MPKKSRQHEEPDNGESLYGILDGFLANPAVQQLKRGLESLSTTHQQRLLGGLLSQLRQSPYKKLAPWLEQESKVNPVLEILMLLALLYGLYAFSMLGPRSILGILVNLPALQAVFAQMQTKFEAFLKRRNSQSKQKKRMQNDEL